MNHQVQVRVCWTFNYLTRQNSVRNQIPLKSLTQSTQLLEILQFVLTYATFEWKVSILDIQ